MSKFITGFLGVLAGAALMLSITFITSQPAPQPGAVSGPEINSPYLSVNGMATFYSSPLALRTATTTPCAILSPAATTTLESFTLNVTTGTSTAGLITIATSTTAYATTSLVTSKTIASGAQGTVNWHAGVDNGLVSPSTYVVAGVQGVAYGFTYIGTCSATFSKVN